MNLPTCQDYKEVPDVEALFALMDGKETKDFCFQLKYDGIWARVIVHDDQYNIYSKTGQHKLTNRLPNRQLFPLGHTLIGEYMMGSQWSQDPERKGKLYVFDCVSYDEADVSQLPYNQRFKLAKSVVDHIQDTRVEMVRTYNTDRLSAVYLDISNSLSWEGLVMREWRSTYYTTLTKLKLFVEDDFVIMGMTAGEGKNLGYMGAMIVGQMDPKGELVEVMHVGGGFTQWERQLFWSKREEMNNKVVLCQGKARFTSGALRHPNFIRVRDDKLASQCILKRTSQ